MTEEPIEITSSTLLKFISLKQLCVLRAKTNQELGFNKILKLQLQQSFQDEINFGLIDISKVDYNDKIIEEFVKLWMPNIGLKLSNNIFPGYYLFNNGTLVAYHPGTIDPSKVDPKIQGMTAIFSAITGLIVGIIEKDTWKGLEAFVNIMEAPQAFKVFEFFNEVLGEKKSSHSQERQRTVYEGELEKAYKILGVSPDVSDFELSKAWKALQLKWHPDKSQDNKEERTKIIAEINNAYDIIKKSRTKMK